MKIIHLILSKGFAGTERYVCDLANHQQNKNKVYIIKLKTNNTDLFKKNTSKKIIYFEISNFFKKICVKKIINKIQPDIIHAHLGNAAKILKKKWGFYKTVTTMHMNFNKKYFNHIDGIICSNNHQLKNIKKIYKGKIIKILLWPIEKFKNQKNNLKQKLKIPSDYYIFGSIGRFHPQKGFDFLAKSFDEIKLNKTILLLVGNGHEQLKKKYTHNKNIIFLDHIKHPTNIYQILDSAVFVSRWESFGITLIEAMQHKLPIITTVHEGNKDWIGEFNVTKIKIDNIKQLKKSLIFFENSKPQKKNYKLDNFNYQKNCNKIEKFYKSLLK